MISEEALPKIKPGSTVKVQERIKEGGKERTSTFSGVVLARKHGTEPGGTFTVRAEVAGIGVEKIFPIHSPTINKVEILSTPKRVRRAKLYYLRELSHKKTRQKLGEAEA
ncbi:MAG: 50S ribosomal protein L19 [Candidatus Colwellbacteria bacterium]|nr:50S ribosomal protein L19 [Candidatus Colwellbacteria bacterium]